VRRTLQWKFPVAIYSRDIQRTCRIRRRQVTRKSEINRREASGDVMGKSATSRLLLCRQVL